MTRRGRITLAGLAGLAVAVGLLGTAASLQAARSADPVAPAPASAPGPVAEAEPPQPRAGVAAPARSAARVGASVPKQGSAQAKEVAEQVLAPLPVTRAALQLPTYRPLPDGSPMPPAGLAGPTLPGEAAPFGERLQQFVPLPAGSGGGLTGPLRVEYTLDAELTRRVFKVLRRGRVALGHVILLDPRSGRMLAYASTDVEQFPPDRTYPAASLVKVITAAAALDRDRARAGLPCRYSGSPYRLTPSRVDPPRRGHTISLRRALATSNNQCFAQLAVHAVGSEPLVQAIERFGWLARPAPAHPAGSVETGDDRYDLGRLGCGLAGCRITPLHAAQLAATLVRGERVAPRWVERVRDARGREMPLPALAAPRRVMSPELAAELRSMLVDTTVRGTARSAFRKRNGRPLLGSIQVAGKTGSLSGRDPKGRYEWFMGVAPADEPRVAVAVVLVQGHLWWRNASQIAASTLESVFCERGRCAPEQADRFLHPAPPETTTATLLP